MRAREILREDSASAFESDLEDLLIAAKANGINDINVDTLVDQLNAMGHSVTPDSLISDLENMEDEHPFIDTVTLNTIKLKSHTVDDNDFEDYEDREVDAERMASKAAMKGVKNKQQTDRKISKDMK